MPSLIDCLGKIDLGGKPSHFWNEADHAHLLKEAKKIGDMEAVKKMEEKTNLDIEGIRKYLTESESVSGFTEIEQKLLDSVPESREPAIKAAVECLIINGLL